MFYSHFSHVYALAQNCISRDRYTCVSGLTIVWTVLNIFIYPHRLAQKKIGLLQLLYQNITSGKNIIEVHVKVIGKFY